MQIHFEEILTYVPTEERWFDMDGFSRCLEMNSDGDLIEYQGGLVRRRMVTGQERDCGLRVFYVQ